MIDRTPEYDNIFNECLDLLLSGDQTLAGCLKKYPQYAHRLQPDLQIALLINQLPQPAMSSGSVDALEARLRQQVPRPVPKRAKTPAPLGKLAAMIAIVFLLTLGVGGGAVAASANSLPGDPLYGLKRWWEAVVLALSSLTDSTDDIWLHLAQTRLKEAEDLARRGTISSTLYTDIYIATAQAIAQADAETAPQVIAFLAAAQARVDNMPSTAATEPLRQDLLALMQDYSLAAPESFYPPSLQPTVIIIQSPEPTATATPTHTPTSTSTATPSPRPTQTASPTATFTPSMTTTPTSRVPATATPSITPRPTEITWSTTEPTPQPTATWTPIPLPVITLPSQHTPSPTRDSGIRAAGGNTPDDNDNTTGTFRYRATQGAVYATQTAQVAQATQEVEPD